MRIYTQGVTLGAAVVAVLAGTAMTAHTTGTAEQQDVGVSEAEMQDLAVIAEDRGITLDEARARVVWQDDFSIAATAVAESFPESFLESEITSELPAVATIRFKGEVPDGAEKFVTGLPDSITVVLEPGAGMSAMERDEMIIEAHKAVSASGLVDDVVSFYDRNAHVVRIEAHPARPMDSAARSAATAEVLADVPANVRNNIALEINERVQASGEVRYGGGRLETSGSSGLECTAGFNVVNSSGTTGVATAGHCDTALTHENTNGATEYTLSHRAQHRGAWGDFQWHTSTQSEPDDFYYIPTSRRDVAAISNPSLNQTLCRFGHRTGGALCNKVADVTLCATYDGIQHCRLVRMNNDKADRGDSGGPWYSGNTAYGFHAGQTSCGSTTCDTWSRATYIDNALNVDVRTL